MLGFVSSNYGREANTLQDYREIVNDYGYRMSIKQMVSKS